MNSSNTYRTGDDPGAIMRFGGLEIYFKEIRRPRELQSGQVGYEHVGCMCRISKPAWNPWSRALAVRWRPCPPHLNRVAFAVRGPENPMLELIET